ncbi:cytochrome c biogenesis protein CcdA [Gimesia chilikensis]|uniref:cytochrome c biogenesis protein CcdA n=1 Tax=Gimesia chilikensis TaxID=2605989 RepID=UPI0011882AB8|nr:cytochrome c biogenesis protein CcdA [Gimesia chilikensis]QDT86703.1 Thiol:disulfide interchange protein DsbD precursor [Gimesia chilikensis]
MKTPRHHTAIVSCLTIFAFLLCVSLTLSAQKPALQDFFNQKQAGAAANASKATISSSLLPHDAKAGETVTLSLTMQIPEGSYTYSTNPTFGGATKFVIEEAKGVTAVDENFQADHPPKKVFEPLFEKEIEKFTGQVTWSRRFKVNADVKDPSQVEIKGQMIYQVCDQRNCVPSQYAFTATLSGKSASPQQSAPLSLTIVPERNKVPDPLALNFALEPAAANPENLVDLKITMKLEDPEFHTFALDHDKTQAGLPTHIEIFKLEGLKPVSGQFTVNPEPEEETHGDIHQRTHYNEVTWTRQFERLPGAKEIGLEGELTYQICNKGSCRRPMPVKFQLGDVANAQSVAMSSLEELKADSAAAADDEIFVTSEESNQTLASVLFFAFLGGLILNVMPCVLPVVAIKVMSFVQQAGESRLRIFLLNIFYSLGVLAVFLSLASLAVFAEMGWGGLFQSTKFNIIMACIVYAMGLSMLGVFEIPVPGMVGSAAGGEQKEGLTGAFLTGILATLLATPCSGPFLGPVLAWSVQQPPGITYLVWLVMGLGMTSPYLIFSVFPNAIKFLPKPGMWMVRFKEFSGIVLMGAVIFIISFLDESLTIPVLIMLLGITTGLWMIGSLYSHSSPKRLKMTVRVVALLLTTGICFFGYNMSQKSTTELPWVPFNAQELKKLRSEKRTVLIDFSAEWCLTCKLVERQALNTPKTLEMVQKYKVVPMYADYTDYSPAIKEWLDKFKSISIPLTVIFPADRTKKPIIIRDLYTQSTLLSALKQAVDESPASKSAPKQAMVSTESTEAH